MCVLDRVEEAASASVFALVGLSLDDARRIKAGVQDVAADWSAELSRSYDGQLSVLVSDDRLTLVVTRERAGLRVDALVDDAWTAVVAGVELGGAVAAVRGAMRRNGAEVVADGWSRWG